MMRLRRASVIVTLSLLACAATASAECAWVFWLEVIEPPTHESSSRPLSGWETREACEQALTHKLALDSEKDTGREMTVDRQAGRSRLWVRRKGRPEALAVYTYGCLPDTVRRVQQRRHRARARDPAGQSAQDHEAERADLRRALRQDDGSLRRQGLVRRESKRPEVGSGEATAFKGPALVNVMISQESASDRVPKGAAPKGRPLFCQSPLCFCRIFGMTSPSTVGAGATSRISITVGATSTLWSTSILRPCLRLGPAA
jgi:hypothetical protein